MKHFYAYVFFVFITINATSTLFCARKKLLQETDTDPVYVYHRWFFEIFATPNNPEIIKKEIESERGHQLISQTCSKSKSPILFKTYCKNHNVDTSHRQFLEYAKNILGPWAIDAREKQLPRPVPNACDVAVLNELKDKLPWSVSNIVVGYTHEPTFKDHGINDKQIVHIKQNFSKNINPKYAVEVLPEATFNEFLNNLAARTRINVDNLQLVLRPNFSSLHGFVRLHDFIGLHDFVGEYVNDMKKLAYAILSSRCGSDLILGYKLNVSSI